MIEDLAKALADRYRIERELGAGGMATVYLAHDLRHDRDVAVKVLHPELGAALGGERFLSEIKTTAKLQHPHILPLLDSGGTNGLLYYVMPFVTGETLRDRLTRERQLPIEDALRIAREAADALGYAHGLGIIHRDIKPENILLQGGHALVADFGIALAVQSAGGARMTQTGLSLGTPQYMSPEQAMGERTIDARSDIYALGAVTYEMLVGEPPFTGPSVQAIVARVMSEEPRSITRQRKAIPPGVEDAVLRALEKLPADRFSSAREFGAALDARTMATTRATRVQPTALGGRRTIGIVSAIALAAIGVALWGWLRPQPPGEVVRYRIPLDSVRSVRNWTGELAISPDGSVLVHTGGPNDKLVVRRRNELSFTPMPFTEGALGPFFSPDGTQIGYVANGQLMVAALAGGPPTVLADSLVGPEACSWSNDGYIYRFHREGNVIAVARMAATPGAALQPVTVVDTAAGETSHFLPEILPDGKGLLFQVGYRDGRLAIAAAELGRAGHRVLVAGTRARYSRSGHLLYTTNDGKLWSVRFDARALEVKGTPTLVSEGVPTTIVGPTDFAVSASGTLVYAAEDASVLRELVWVSRNGQREQLDATWEAAFSNPAISPDGTQLAVTVRDASSSDVWIKRVAGGAPVKLTLENKSNEGPSWTSDGRSVSYLSSSSVSSNVGDVWWQPADGSRKGVRILHLNARPISEHVWSPLGGWLVVRTTTSTMGAGDILASRPGADSSVAPLLATRVSEYTPTLSPDGRWMAYSSNESGRFEVYVVPFPTPGSAKWQVSAKGGGAPRWSRRGGELFYLDLQGNLVAVRVSTSPSFTLHGASVLFDATEFEQAAISRRNYDVSADDQRFLMVRRVAGTARGQVVVVENWFEELRARAKQ